MGRKLSVEQAAEEAGVSTRTFRRWIAAGRVEAFRIGPRLIRVDMDQVWAKLMAEPITSSGGDAA